MHYMDNITKFFDAVDTLVRIAEDNQLDREDCQTMMSRGMWLREMATVSLTVPRRVCKTSYILKRARCADLIVVHNHEMKRVFRESSALVVTLPELISLTRGRTQRGFNRVYVDEPSHVFGSRFSVDEFYSLFCDGYGGGACANLFVMLGT